MKNIVRIGTSLVCACVMSLGLIGAAGSITNNGTVSQDFTINGKKVDSTKVEATFKTDFTGIVEEAEVVETIDAINEAPAKVAEILASITVQDDKIDTADLQLLTTIQDLSIIDKETGEIMKDAKNVTITWEVPNLTEKVGEVRVLHYSTVRKVWELITPDSVDYATKTVTATFPDLSPVAVVYVPADKTGTNTKPVDKEDDKDAIKGAGSSTEHGALVFAGIMLLAGAGYLVVRKSRA